MDNYSIINQYQKEDDYLSMDISDSQYTTEPKDDQQEERIVNETNNESVANEVFTKINLLEINNGWNDNNEKIVVSIGENAASYKWMHDKSAQIYSNLRKILGFLLVMINTGLSAQTLLPENSNIQAIVILRQVFIYIVTFVSVLQNFLKYEESKMRHNDAASKFSSLYHKIQQQMATYRQNRSNANVLISEVLKQYDSLVVAGPDIHFYALSQFKKLFSKTDLSVPDIADKIQRIEIITEGNNENKTKSRKANQIKTRSNLISDNRENDKTNLNTMKQCFRIKGDITDDDLKNLNEVELKELKRRIGNEKRIYELQRYEQHLDEPF
jgi:hypothetical protein